MAIDTHTHTLLSGHAWSTLNENIACAAKAGLAGICLTEHGPAIPGGVVEFAPRCQFLLPEEIDKIRIYKGVEASIIAMDGTLDLQGENIAGLEYVIASFHVLAIEPLSQKENTKACIAALENPHVNTLGHPCLPGIDLDTNALAREAAALGKALELNNNSIRMGMRERCRRMLCDCMKHGTRIALSSDAHYCLDIGNMALAVELVQETKFPVEYIVNDTREKFDLFIAGKAG